MNASTLWRLFSISSGVTASRREGGLIASLSTRRCVGIIAESRCSFWQPQIAALDYLYRSWQTTTDGVRQKQPLFGTLKNIACFHRVVGHDDVYASLSVEILCDRV